MNRESCVRALEGGCSWELLASFNVLRLVGFTPGPHGPKDSGHFVGKRDGRFVVTGAQRQINRPDFEARESLSLAHLAGCRQQRGTRAMGK